ncbi:MAG: hypothetical protein GZ085_00490 [Sulfuriferula multivorans]|uniref:Uncharacterized protein n=1 Tax=Sulfuriferula multivorans TaxID=1559896 RepID=A0A7C9P4S7_9PROT|nr:hypothetical protein [Sulfuriferula multivorans]
MRTFSKSKLLALRQCPKPLWLEVHRLTSRHLSGVLRGVANFLAQWASGRYSGC